MFNSCIIDYLLFYFIIFIINFNSVLWHGWVIWPVKPVPDMTYNVFSGTLNPTQSITINFNYTILPFYL